MPVCPKPRCLSLRPDTPTGVVIIAGIDRFMSEARALTSLVSNAVACIVIAMWECDLASLRREFDATSGAQAAAANDRATAPRRTPVYGRSSAPPGIST